MNCEERRDQWLLYVLSSLDDQDRSLLDDHLQSGCATCAASLAEAEDVVAKLAFTAEPREPSAQVRERLLSQLHRLPQSKVIRPVRLTTLERVVRAVQRQAAVWLLLALTLGVSAAFAAAYVRLSSAIQQQTMEVRNLRHKVLSRDEMINDLRIEVNDLRTAAATQAVQVALMEATELQQDAAWAYVLWDPNRQLWLFFAEGMKPNREGYHLWLRPDDAPAELIGRFNVSPAGSATLRAVQDGVLSDNALLMVTSEPTTDASQPSGPTHLRRTR